MLIGNAILMRMAFSFAAEQLQSSCARRTAEGGCPHTFSQNDCFIFDFTLWASFSICSAFLIASTDMVPCSLLAR